jgi:hypothetical protein
MIETENTHETFPIIWKAIEIVTNQEYIIAVKGVGTRNYANL